MKKITIWLLKRHLKAAKKYRDGLNNAIVKSAYGNLIKNYKDTIMFLESEIASESRK